ncbi:uncharacterized, partial [Tachysurus ichikawai]
MDILFASTPHDGTHAGNFYTRSTQTGGFKPPAGLHWAHGIPADLRELFSTSSTACSRVERNV